MIPMAVEFKDYYEILGVPRTANDEQIRKSFRKLARQYHPDVAKNKASAEEKFKEINEAYEVLSDPEKRKKYDQLGANWNRAGGFAPPPGWKSAGRSTRGKAGDSFEFQFGGTGFSDFFEQFFGGRAGGFGNSTFSSQSSDREWPFDASASNAQRGSDVQGDIMVTLDEVLKGSVRSVSLQRRNPQTGAHETHSFRVKIPPGVREGRLIRVAGKGETGIAGGTAGDLYLRVKFAKHPDLRVRGADLYYDLELAPWEAVLGATVSVSTLEKPVSLKIRPGTKSDQQLRIRGHGLPGEHGTRGDLYAVVKIEVPENPSAEEKALWEQLAEKSEFNPRRS